MNVETMHPTMVRGLSGYRAETTPPAELDGRMATVRSWLAQEGLDAVLVHGDPRQYGRLCYLTGMVPMSRWAAVLVPRDDAPTLLAAVSGSRDLPFMRTLSYVENVIAVEDLTEQLPLLVGSTARVGLIVESGIPSRVYRAFRAVAQLRELSGDFLDARMRRPSTAELVQIRSLTALTQRVADQVTRSYLDGAEPSTALIDGERYAREQRAHDVRMLLSVDRGLTMGPFERPTAANSAALVWYLAVEAGGYWSHAFRTASRGTDDDLTTHVDHALRMGTEAARAQRSTAAVIDALRTTAPGLMPHEAIENRLLVRLGLWSPPEVVDPGEAPLPRGIYGLRAGTRSDAVGAIGSRIVEVGPEGVELLG